MTTEGQNNKERLALLGSVVINIFLVAFVLGRISVFDVPPPPPPPPGGGPAMHGDMPPPPPMVGPAELLSPREMRADMDAMQGKFENVRELRKAFADKLKAGPVTKEEVLDHFKQVDQLMSEIRDQTQEKMATKISTLTPDQRERFADRFARSRRGPGGPGGSHPHDRPGDHMPPPPPEGQP
jgi:uncharacterized membrane protein